RDRHRRVEEEVREAALVLLGLERGLDGAVDEHEPEQHPGDERDLEDAAELDVLVPLVPDEVVVAELALDARPGASERADDDDDERAEQRQHERLLALRLLAADGGADDEAGGEP